MQQQRSGVWWVVGVLVLGAGVLYVLLSSAKGTPRHDAHERAEARLAAVRAASAATLPATTLLSTWPSVIQGDRRASGPLATYALVYRRRIDFDGLSMADEDGGPVRPLLRLAERQAALLAEAGFEPMRAAWIAAGQEGRQPVDDPDEILPEPPPPPGSRQRGRVAVDVRHQSDSGGGGGVRHVDLDAPRIVHQRIYALPQSAATLFVRNAYHQASRVVDVEFSYTDRTLFGVTYPTGSHIVGRQPGHYAVHESILPPD